MLLITVLALVLMPKSLCSGEGDVRLMKLWSPVPQNNPKPVVVILRSLLGSPSQKGTDLHRARYKDLWESVRDELNSETTFQVYLNWLVKKRIVKREKRSRKEVWYSVNSGDSIVLGSLEETVATLKKLKNWREEDFEPIDLFEEVTSRCIYNLSVATVESLRPVDQVAWNLGPDFPTDLLAEDLALLFKISVFKALVSKNPGRFEPEILGAGGIVERLINAIGTEAQKHRSKVSSIIKSRTRPTATPVLEGDEGSARDLPLVDASLGRVEALKLLRSERQFWKTKMARIEKSYTKSLISQQERDRLIGKYKLELTRLEKDLNRLEKPIEETGPHNRLTA